MNIRKVRDILKRGHEVSLKNLSLETGESEEELKYILEDWKTKKRITVVEELPFCTSGGCSGCAFASSCSSPGEKKYKWISFKNYKNSNVH